MSGAPTTEAVPLRAVVAERDRPDFLARFLAVVPLASIYLALAALYAWQASRHPVPTIFTDELELTQLSRSIAETGEPARRGVPYGVATLVAYVLAPLWWLGTTSTAYATAKLLLVLAMTATIFPAYLLARLVVPKWYALAAAGGATAGPALAYSPIFVEEPLAYPVSTLALWLIARTLMSPSWGRVSVAALASGIATLTRTQLAVLFAVLVLGLLWIGWQSEPIRRWRAEWGGWDWAGAATLVLGVALGFSAAMGHLSTSWRETTFVWKDRIFEHASWAAGALAIGVGVLPVIAGIAALARPRNERGDPETRAFVVTSVAALAVFLFYAGIKGAYISTVFSTVVVERNLIYLCPVLFAATAMAIVRGVGRAWAIAGAAAFALYTVSVTPLNLNTYPYYEAHGLSIAHFANRELGWAEGTIEAVLVIACIVSLAVVLGLRLLPRSSPAFSALGAIAAIAVVAWSMTGQVYAAQGERMFSERFDKGFPKPYDWVDRATDGESVVVVGQQISDPTNVWLTEFFNRSIRKMWSLDGTARNVGGPILTPDLQSPDGTLTPSPETRYALALNDVELQAPKVRSRGRDTLYRIDGRPLKLAAAVTGLYGDGWMADDASYTRYDVSRDGPGFAVVKLSRVRWCGKDVPGKATVRIGPVAIGPDKQPTIGRVTDTQTKFVHHCVTTPFIFRVPSGPWRVEVTLKPTFVPQKLDPTKSDRRELGAVFEAGFQSLFGG